ncbi:hypothetical protein FRC0061_01980 [Corynebacterium diphtheriae]|nr:hypothetical protein CIP107517_01897 [Corynebacterium diphtheriae]CAB0568821.1 hypothetical protein CIP107515_01989 [Corynebacterium diphtheriae]CAB0657653.1 hypothetical protein CIP107565_01692 [Corynebacterium diphtheriae]CAB0710687.1 hypothetical protein FRC0061_01980 [Corynebacterium diphtheriae]CAB0872448.1 hypothetical protein FRC0383_02056 [Corynebacterium diphtheriae]
MKGQPCGLEGMDSYNSWQELVGFLGFNSPKEQCIHQYSVQTRYSIIENTLLPHVGEDYYGEGGFGDINNGEV